MIMDLMADDPDFQKTEFLGEEALEDTYFFPPEIVEPMLTLPPYPIPTDYIPYFFMAVDPGAGGTFSDFSIASGFKYRGQFVLCGIESDPTGDVEEMKQLCMNHLKRCYDLFPFLRNCKVIFSPESNLGNESQHIWNHVRAFEPRPQLFQSGPENRIGFMTTRATKLNAITALQKLMRDKKIVFAEKLAVTCRALNPAREARSPLAIKCVCDQMMRIKKHFPKVGRGMMDMTKYKIHGKGNDPAHPQKDDVAMAIFVLIETIHQFMVNPW